MTPATRKLQTDIARVSLAVLALLAALQGCAGAACPNPWNPSPPALTPVPQPKALAATLVPLPSGPAAGAAISGCVLDERGLAIEEVPVAVRRTRTESYGSEHASAATDAVGAFRLAPLHGGRYDLWLNGDWQRPLGTVVVPAGVAAVLELRLARGLAISGIIVDVDGAPLAGVQLFVDPPPLVGFGRLRSDEHGHFVARGLRPGEHEIWVDHHGQRHAGASVRATAGSRDVRLQLAVAGSIAGDLRVVPAADRLTGGFPRVFAEPGPGWPGPRRTCFTARPASGEYRIDGLPPGAYRVFGASSFATAPVVVEDVKVVPGRETRVDLTVGRGARVSGRVLALPDRRPVAHANVWILPGVPLGVAGSVDYSLPGTDADGRFVLHGFAPGRHELRGQVRGSPTGRTTVVVRPGATDVTDIEILLPEGGAIEGHVKHENLRPWTRGRIDVRTLRGWWRYGASLEAEGSYAVRGLAPGVYGIRFRPDTSWERDHAQDVRLPPRIAFVRPGKATHVDLE